MCIYVYSFIMCKKYDRLLEIRLTLRRAMDAKYINYILMSLLLDEETRLPLNCWLSILTFSKHIKVKY